MFMGVKISSRIKIQSLTIQDSRFKVQGPRKEFKVAALKHFEF
jgi:hypothetical protein